MDNRMETTGKLPKQAEPMMAAALVLEVTKSAWLGAPAREPPASAANRLPMKHQRAPIQRNYLKLLALEI